MNQAGRRTSLPSAAWRHVGGLFRAAGHRLTLAFGLMVACSLTEGLGLLLLIPMLQAVGLDLEGGPLGGLAGFIARAFSTLGLQPTLGAVLALYVAVCTCQALLVRWQSVTNEVLGYRFVERLRSRLYAAIANSNWLFLSRMRSSSLTHALTSEIDRVNAATYCLVSLAATAAITSVYTLLALRLSALTTVLVFSCGGTLMWAVGRKNAATRASGENASATARVVYALAIEHLQSVKITKSYAAEERSSSLFARGAARMADAFVETMRLRADSKALFDVGSVAILAMLVMLAVGVQKLPAAGVFLLLFLFARIMPRASSIQQGIQQYASLVPSLDAVESLQRECEAAIEMPCARVECPAPSGSIRLESVSFTYAPDGNFSILDLNLTIQMGATTALVGPSGSGKSTVADLLIGLLSPQAGCVLIDDKLLRPEMLASWRKQIGYVPQETWLFHDTVRANLAWARGDAGELEMLDALRLAAADEIVRALPSGLDTVLGDRGVRLSGGERQRIALARALLRKPSLLILDEATSAIDGENERRILDAIGRLHGTMTILIITHRLVSVRSADKIYVLEQGHLTEDGSWDTLTSAPGSRFRGACLAQGILLRDDGSVANGTV